MSEIRATIGDVLADRETVFGDAVTNLRTGLKFVAEIEEVADIALNTELGRDPRENTIFHVRSKLAADGIRAGDRLSALGAAFLVLAGARTDNPVSLQVDFGCMKITNKDS